MKSHPRFAVRTSREEPLDPEQVAFTYEVVFCKKWEGSQDHDWTEHLQAAGAVVIKGYLAEDAWEKMRRISP